MNLEYNCDENTGSIGPSASQFGGDAIDAMSVNDIMEAAGFASPLGLGSSASLVGTAHIYLSPCRSVSGEETRGYASPSMRRYNKRMGIESLHHSLSGSPRTSRNSPDYSYYDDADSGISTSRHCSPIRVNCPRSAGASLSSPSHKLYKPTPSYVTPVASPSRPPSRVVSVDLEQALDSSECRRHLLTQKLIDAKDTIHQQSERLSSASTAAKESTCSVESLKHKEKQYKMKIEELEMDRCDYHKINMGNMRHADGLEQRLVSVDLEKRSIEASYKLLEVEAKTAQSELSKSLSCVGLLKQDNDNLAKTKESGMKEVSALKESLAITRGRNESLENQSRDTKVELENLRQENWSLTKEVKSLMKQLGDMKKANFALMEAQRALQNKVEDLAHERQRLMVRLTEMEESLRESKMSCDLLAEDKDRFLKEAVKLTRQVQAMSFEADDAHRVKLALDDEVAQCNTDLALSKLEVDRKSEANRKLQDELAAVKKVSELLSVELSTSKEREDELMSESVSLEQTKKIAYQQHQLYEDEIHNLGAQLTKVQQSMESLNRNHVKEKDALNSQLIKLKGELRKAKSERNEMEQTAHDFEKKLTQSSHNSKQEAASQQRELDKWKQSCEQLTASVGRKEMEVVTLTQKLEQLEQQHEFLDKRYTNTKEQLDELDGTAETLDKLKGDHRHLLLEKAENLQLIELLEVQKNVLSKNVEDNLARTQDITELQQQVEDGKIITLKVQGTLNEQECVNQTLERQKESLQVEIEKLTRSAKDMTTRMESFQQDSHQLHSEMAQLSKENSRLKGELEESVAQVTYDRLKEEKAKVNTNYKHLRQQFQELEENHHQLVTNNYRKRKNDGDTVLSLTQDKENLDGRVAMLDRQVATLETEKLSAEDQIAELEHQAETLEQEATENSKRFASEVKTLEKQMDLLQLALEVSQEAQRDQASTIQTLTEEIGDEKTKEPSKIARSLEDAGEELVQMRTELHQLIEVIETKDQTIETLEGRLSAMKDANRSEEIESAEKENTELKTQISQLNEKLENLVRTPGEDVPSSSPDEHQQDRLVDDLRRELRSKDRQIENLEEQLSRRTLIKIKKLKRDASKVELLKVENRRLHNQLHTPGSSKTATTGEDSTDSSTGPDNREPSWVKTYVAQQMAVSGTVQSNADDADVSGPEETADSMLAKAEESLSEVQNNDTPSPLVFHEDANHTVVAFEKTDKSPKSEEQIESTKHESTENCSKTLGTSLDENIWGMSKKAGRLSPLPSRESPVDSCSKIGVRTGGSRQRNSLASSASASPKPPSSVDDQVSSSSESIGSMLRSNARLLRTSDLLLSGRSSSSPYSGSPMPFRQSKSFRPSSEFTSSIPRPKYSK